jgi:tetratricopeptide (TPR) repeat protein
MRVQFYIALFFSLLLCSNLFAQNSNLIAMGYQKLEARELNDAIGLFAQVLREDPRDTSALSGIIRAHLLGENLKEAQRFIETAIKEHPRNPEYYLRRGILNNLRGQYKRAITDFDRAIDLSSGRVNIQIYINRGVSNMQDLDYTAAIEDFSDALNINPRNISALNYRAFSNYRQGNFTESINDYNKSLDLNPENAMSYYNRGMAYLRSGDRTNACSDFHQACSRGNVNGCRMIMTECSGSKN